MSNDPQQVRDLRLTRSPPFVELIERPERRDEHRTVALIMAAVALLVVVTDGPAVAGVLPAFIAGYALCNWLTFEARYGSEG